MQKEIFEEKTQGRRKRRNIFGEGKTEIEKEENVSRVKEKLRGGNEKNGEGKRGKYLQKEKEENIWRRKRRKYLASGRKKNRKEGNCWSGEEKKNRE